MSKPHLSAQEVARLDALHEYDILDTPPEAVFDNLARLAAHICRTPIALINFIDRNRQWFKASIGWSFSELPREFGFCHDAILQPELLIVPDACQDSRANNPLVTCAPHIRFYAGMPLITPSGHAIGTLCVMDQRSRTLDQKQAERLSNLARRVLIHLETRRQSNHAARVITNSQQMQETLKQFKPSLSAIFNSNLQAIVFINWTYKVQTFNKIAFEWVQRIYGRALKAGDSIYEFVEPEHLDRFNSHLKTAFQGKVVQVEHLLKGIKNTHWFEFDYSPVFNDKNRVIGVCLVGINIDRQKTALEALAKSEERLRSLMQNSSDIITVLEADGTIRYVSPSVERILGYKATEVVGKNTFAYVHPEDVPSYYAKFAKTLQHPELVVLSQLRVRHADGFWISVETATNNQLDNASVKGVVINTRDITERCLAQAKISFQGHLLDAVEQAVIAKDLDGKIIYWNRFAQTLYGWSAEEVVGRSILEVLSTENSKEQAADILSLLQSGKSWTGEFLAQRRDGTTFPTLVAASPVYDNTGKLIGIVGVSSDITERKQTEQQIQASLKEKEVLLQEIHHRVKNNLQVICSLLNLQSGYIKDQQALLSFKESQSRIKSIALLHEHLYQSKKLSQINFAEYVQQLAVNLFRAYGVNSAAISLKIHVEDVCLGVDTAITCGLIINELVSNCIKHAFLQDQSGEICILLIRARNQDNKLILTVRDNGVGFPKHIDFRNTKSLGLQLVNTLVAQLKGNVKFNHNSVTECNINFTIR